MYKAIAFLLVIVSLCATNCPAAAERLQRFAQRGDVMTMKGVGGTRESACNASIQQAKNLCSARNFFNVTKVDCECSQVTMPGGFDSWQCIGVVTCQE